MGRRDDDDRDELIVRRGGGGNATIWVLLAGSAAALLCVGLAGVGLFWLVPRGGGPGPGRPVDQSAPARPAKYTRDEFRALVVGKTEDEVIAAVGRPTTTHNVAGDVFWTYEGMTYDPSGSQVDLRAKVLFERGKVSRVDF